MKISILDDYHDTLRTLPCFSKLAGHDVTIWNDHAQDLDILADRLRDTEALVLIRERTKIRRRCSDRLPKLELISQRSVYPHIDIDACTRRGVIVSSNPASRHTVLCHSGTDLGADSCGDAPDSPADGRAQGGQVADRRRQHPARKDARNLRLRPNRRRGRRLRQGVRHEGGGVGARSSLAQARADGYITALSKAAFFEKCDVISLHMRLVEATRGIVTAGRSGPHEADGARCEYQPCAADRARRAGQQHCGPDARGWPRSTSMKKSR